MSVIEIVVDMKWSLLPVDFGLQISVIVFGTDYDVVDDCITPETMSGNQEMVQQFLSLHYGC